MTPLRTLVTACFLSMTVWGAGPAWAQTAPSMTPEYTNGVVRKVDIENKKLTIRHEEIKNLEMPPMTMVFTVKESAVLPPLQVGDKIKFAAVRENGKFVVTDVQPSP
jgi:Cu(I)/Ag(I) efflux system protein CusF